MSNKIKISIGVSLLLLDMMLVIAGVICLIIGSVVGEHRVSSTAETLLTLGFIGTGMGIGSAATEIGTLLIAYGFIRGD